MKNTVTRPPHNIPPVMTSQKTQNRVLALHMIESTHKGELDRPVKLVEFRWWPVLILAGFVALGLWFGKV